MSIEIPQVLKLITPFCGPASGSDVPAVSVVEINDPTAIGEAMELVEQDVVQLDSKPMRFRRVVVRLKTAVVVYQSTNRPGRSLTKLQDGHVAFTAFGPRAAGTLNGMALGPDRVMASPSGIEVEFVVEAGYESVAFLLPQDDFNTHLTGKSPSRAAGGGLRLGHRDRCCPALGILAQRRFLPCLQALFRRASLRHPTTGS